MGQSKSRLKSVCPRGEEEGYKLEEKRRVGKGKEKRNKEREEGCVLVFKNVHVSLPHVVVGPVTR